jgi:hypothetical protein
MRTDLRRCAHRMTFEALGIPELARSAASGSVRPTEKHPLPVEGQRDYFYQLVRSYKPFTD